MVNHLKGMSGRSGAYLYGDGGPDEFSCLYRGPEGGMYPAGLHDIIVSNTFTRKWEMQPYLDLAEKYGWTVFVLTCENNFGNIHGVGVGIIDNMKRRWENYDG